MADDAVFASRSENKRKYDETGAAPPPRRVSGFSSPPADYHPPASSTPPSYNSVPPQPDGIQIAKQRAQEIAARLLIDAEAKRPRTENGGSGEDFGVKDHLHKPPFANSYSSNNSSTSFSSYGYSGANKKIEVPNGKVGVIIGKSGETIKYLQLQSGAKIQVTRDAEVDPYSQTRTVEISGTSEQVSKAEQLINDVLKEADAGMVSTKKYAGIQAGGEQFVMKVPNNKVGLVIGKGGEMIKGMQAKSGARIQIIPLHLPPGDTSTERTVQIDGTSEQIEAAKQLVNEVISDNRMRNPSAGGGYSQPGYSQPRPPTSWAPPGPPPTQPPSYGYMQTGAYPGPPPHYPPMSQPQYASYPPSSGGYPVSNASYDYYGQQLPPPPPISSSSAPEASGGYSQGQHQPSYSQDPYSESQHTAPQPQGYGQDSSYSSSGYPPGPQAGYTHPPSSQHVYDQQQNYGPPAGYDSSSAPPVYGTQPATASQGSLPPPPPLQGYGGQPPSSTLPPSYPSHQASGQQSQPGYGVPPPSQPGYGSQPPSTGYGQAGYVQQKAPTGPPGVYGQGQPGYGPPGQSQPGYAQSSASQPGYGSYGQPQPGYGGPPPPYDAYGSAPVGAGYSQPPVGYSSDGSATASVQAPFDATSAPAAKAPQS